ncbi:MAG: hypothetical protein LBM69_06210 [Lachnospiraceae bacterium]|jgi:hypothetical protein|nr:hypothetical protein [Lachnospiraceae bacterium]
MQIELGFTSLSQNEVANILGKELTLEQVREYLEQEIHIRSFPEILAAYYPGSDIREKLIDGLQDPDGKENRDSTARRVRNWLSAKFIPDNREDLIRICFALGLSDHAADDFLSLTDEGRFHYRNPRELAFAYCLRVGKPYAHALELIRSLKPLDANAKVTSPVFTKTIADSFATVRDDASFRAFYIEKYDALGTLHNTAYYKSFLPFLNTLIHPDMPWCFTDERNYTIEEIVNEYLRMNIPLDRKTAKLTVLQKTIRKYWPNATIVKRMRNREIDVNRKMLMLLYLVTNGSVATEGSYTGDDTTEELTTEEQFENHFWAMNAMLTDAGMSRLDPRALFDWLTLYCLKTSAEEAMSDRLQSALNFIFEAETS